MTGLATVNKKGFRCFLLEFNSLASSVDRRRDGSCHHMFESYLSLLCGSHHVGDLRTLTFKYQTQMARGSVG